jgi:site-specific DNA-methyltransferase (adenine-specific)
MREYLNITNECNMELMKRFPDNHFDLAIVDPPYGIGESSNNNKSRSKLAKAKDYGNKNWDDKAPDKEYFIELQRVSKNQIIFGANHFIENIPKANSSCWIVWDKVNGESDFADCELAWCSFNSAVRLKSLRWAGMLQHNMKNKEIRIHPTQKPVAIYQWILQKYAEPNFKILDTHLGSGSIAIALDSLNKIEKMNLTLTACELEKDYFKNTTERIIEQTKWESLF